jgi:hypothetical protein
VTVRVFNKHQTASGKDVPIDPEEESKIPAKNAVMEVNDDDPDDDPDDATSTYHGTASLTSTDHHNVVGESLHRDDEIHSLAVDYAMLDQPLRHGRTISGAAQYSASAVDFRDSTGDEIEVGEVPDETAGKQDRASRFDVNEQRKKDFPESKHPAHKKAVGGGHHAKRFKHGDGVNPDDYEGSKPHNYKGSKPNKYKGDKPNNYKGGKPIKYKGGKQNNYEGDKLEKY